MTKIFKNSKQILAFVLAFAVIAISLFTNSAVVTVDAATATIYMEGQTMTNPMVNTATENGSESMPYIIDSVAELYYLVHTNHTSTGKYFKLADGIDTIVLQPESYDTANNLTADMTAEQVKELLTSTTTGRQSWWGTSTFDGVLDLNGATIYGAYAANGGIFGTIGANAVIKNLTVKNCYGSEYTAGLVKTAKPGAKLEEIAVLNSYFTVSGKVGALVADISGTGSVYFTKCMVANNYLHTTATNTDGRAGVLAGGGGSAGLMVDNCLVYGNTATSMEGGVLTVVGLHGNLANNAPGKDSDCTQISNSIILGCTPYGTYPNGANVMMPDNFTNVYTDTIDPLPWSVRGVNWGVTRDSYTGIIEIKDATGAAGKAAIALDWDDVWFANDGIPALRAFHTIDDDLDGAGAMKHTYGKCTDLDCDLVGITENHTYNSSYQCTVCQHQCVHDGAHGMTTFYSDGDCVTSAGKYANCPCGYNSFIATGSAATGHVLTHHEANEGHCQEDAIAEHWTCEVCNKIFLTADVWAGMSTAVEPDDPNYNFGLGSHKKETDAEGFIIYSDITGHWYRCYVCDGKLDGDGNIIEETVVIEHRFKDGACRDCGWQCDEHQFVTTGIILHAGDCTNDRQEQVKCTVCQITGYQVTKEAGHKVTYFAAVDPTDKLEGEKAHYECETCGAIFADAAGKTAVTQASLIIPKTINANGLSNATGDLSYTSPATADNSNLAMVIAATALLSGAILLVVCKAKKA